MNYVELKHRQRAVLEWMVVTIKELSPDEPRYELYFDGETVGFSGLVRKEVDLNELLDLDSMRFVKVRVMHNREGTAYVSLKNCAYLAVMRKFDSNGGIPLSKDELRILERAFAEVGGIPLSKFAATVVSDHSSYRPEDVVTALDRLVAKGYAIKGRFHYALTPEGAAVAEETEEQARFVPPAIPSVSIGNLYGVLQAGTGNSTGDVSVVVNQQVGSAITQLADAVQKSELDQLDKEELLHEIQRLAHLAAHPDAKAKPKMLERLEVIEKAVGISQKLAHIALPLILLIRQHGG